MLEKYSLTVKKKLSNLFKISNLFDYSSTIYIGVKPKKNLQMCFDFKDIYETWRNRILKPDYKFDLKTYLNTNLNAAIILLSFSDNIITHSFAHFSKSKDLLSVTVNMPSILNSGGVPEKSHELAGKVEKRNIFMPLIQKLTVMFYIVFVSLNLTYCIHKVNCNK